MKELQNEILDLHWAGNKDQRLKMLAVAVRLKIPARRGKRKSNQAFNWDWLTAAMFEVCRYL